MPTPRLTPDQISQVTGLVAQYITSGGRSMRPERCRCLRSKGLR